MHPRSPVPDHAGVDTPVAAARPVIHVVDYEHEIRIQVKNLFATRQMDVRDYETAEAFLDIGHYPQPACLIAAVELPGMNGLELLERLSRDSVLLPVILTTNDSTVQSAVRAMRGGAVDFLEKPFVDHVLVQRVRAALAIG